MAHMNKDTKITIIDLLSVVSNKEVLRALKYHYPKTKGDPTHTIEGFRKMKKKKTVDGEWLNVYACGEPSNFDYEKAGIKHGLKEMHEDNYYGIDIVKEGDTQKYGMSFMSWKVAGNLPINTDTLSHYTYADIIAHFLWEITWYGNEAETRKTGKKILARTKSAMKKYKSGKIKGRTLSELKEDLKINEKTKK